jgi:hypothetical protein
LQKVERYIASQGSAVYGGENVACAVELGRPVAACGGNVGASTCERKCEALSFFAKLRMTGRIEGRDAEDSVPYEGEDARLRVKPAVTERAAGRDKIVGCENAPLQETQKEHRKKGRTPCAPYISPKT